MKQDKCIERHHPRAAALECEDCELHSWPCHHGPDSRLETRVTTGRDPALALVGSSYSIGNANNVGLILPPDPTRDQIHRYQCRLATLDIGEREEAELVDYHQLLTIGCAPVPEAGPPAYVLEHVVTSPIWHFADANVSWHFYFERTMKRRQRTAAQRSPGWSPNPGSPDCAIQYQQLPISLGGPGYEPLFGGTLPGEAIAPYGVMYDVRSPWQRPCNCFRGVRVTGAGRIYAWASVHQTDPSTRPSVQLANGGYCDEEVFVQANPLARYWRVGIDMTWRIVPRRKKP